MIYQNDDDEYKKAVELMIHMTFGFIMLCFFGGIGFGLYLIFG